MRESLPDLGRFENVFEVLPVALKLDPLLETGIKLLELCFDYLSLASDDSSISVAQCHVNDSQLVVQESVDIVNASQDHHFSILVLDDFEKDLFPGFLDFLKILDELAFARCSSCDGLDILLILDYI